MTVVIHRVDVKEDEEFVVGGKAKTMTVSNNGTLSVWYIEGGMSMHYKVLRTGRAEEKILPWDLGPISDDPNVGRDEFYYELIDTHVDRDGTTRHLVGVYSRSFTPAPEAPPPLLPPPKPTTTMSGEPIDEVSIPPEVPVVSPPFDFTVEGQACMSVGNIIAATGAVIVVLETDGVTDVTINNKSVGSVRRTDEGLFVADGLHTTPDEPRPDRQGVIADLAWSEAAVMFPETDLSFSESGVRAE